MSLAPASTSLPISSACSAEAARRQHSRSKRVDRHRRCHRWPGEETSRTAGRSGFATPAASRSAERLPGRTKPEYAVVPSHTAPAAHHGFKKAAPDAAVATTNDQPLASFLLFLRRCAPTTKATTRPTAQEMAAAATMSSSRLFRPPEPSTPVLDDGNSELQLVSLGELVLDQA